MKFRQAGLIAVFTGLALCATHFCGCGTSTGNNSNELLNVSYDPTRELYEELNQQFIASYANDAGREITVKQSHGGSAAQARAVLDGLDADIVTLALPSDTDALAKKGLIHGDWEKRLPNDSLPYYSTIVFVVRKGNPKRIKDWPDLIEGDVSIITPNPKTSGNGKLSFLAAWGAVIKRGGTEEAARDYVAKLYERVPVLDSGARGSTTTFVQKNLGDVQITWENEAQYEVEEAKGQLEIIYPPVSIKAEPKVAWVDANVEKKGTRLAAEAYLKFLYTAQAQETFAKHYYRPSNADALKKYAEKLPPIDLFLISSFAESWNAAQERFFAADGVFDNIYQPKK
ncbi:MAG: sulfate ABC transporter substrate-binding protein [Gemmataceae bacterium]